MLRQGKRIYLMQKVHVMELTFSDALIIGSVFVIGHYQLSIISCDYKHHLIAFITIIIIEKMLIFIERSKNQKVHVDIISDWYQLSVHI